MKDNPKIYLQMILIRYKIGNKKIDFKTNFDKVRKKMKIKNRV